MDPVPTVATIGTLSAPWVINGWGWEVEMLITGGLLGDGVVIKGLSRVGAGACCKITGGGGCGCGAPALLTMILLDIPDKLLEELITGVKVTTEGVDIPELTADAAGLVAVKKLGSNTGAELPPGGVAWEVPSNLPVTATGVNVFCKS